MKYFQLAIASTLVLSGGYAVADSTTEANVYSMGASATDGKNPLGGLAVDLSGALYGTTEIGGKYGYGTVFKMTPPVRGGVGPWTETVLYSFKGSQAGDGLNPQSGVIIGNNDTLYGTTILGGEYNRGTVFKVTRYGQETVLYSFTGVGNDGAYPIGSLTIDQNGYLYGTTEFGGGAPISPMCGSFGCGVTFRISPNGQRTTLHVFTGTNGDGAFPIGGMVQGKSGVLYGATEKGGNFQYGEVFSQD